MKPYTMKMIALCAASAALGLGCFACTIKKNDPVFALLGFATLLPFLDGVRMLCKLARADRL
ncbi:putative membrane protein [Paraburkholderia fungorum]|uniref:Membrane protein n=1 Tax=Paraburkholderia fungorum TaxID=134537 RepID=A0AAP5QI60_9BURK|nr:hypothetical protein [Paraburkholderia fungorum]AJZ56501.1 putative membrane protein [Paraburkholderia fungorum]MDT8842647.1 hypothetical protein [Paraburkholderia fungorum]PRZ49209.1 hypothetical protein BX589_126118 [Paraburkholderia fungorum]